MELNDVNEETNSKRQITASCPTSYFPSITSNVTHTKNEP